MFMRIGYSPEFTQVAYRIGDSCTNIITPLMSYFALIVSFAEKYDEDTGIGTLISTMVPYSIFFLIGWILLLIVWFVDRKSTRLNSSHANISYAVFCLKKKKK